MSLPDDKDLLNSYLLSYLMSEKIMDLDSPETPESPTMLNILGYALCQRFEEKNNPTDLDRAIRAWLETLERTSAISPYRSIMLNNFANALLMRYTLTDDLVDLIEAIKVLKLLAEETPVDEANRYEYLELLGKSLMMYY